MPRSRGTSHVGYGETMTNYGEKNWSTRWRGTRGSRPEFLRRLRQSLSAVFMVGALVLAGCASPQSDEGASETEVALPDTGVGGEAGWVLDVVNAEKPVEATEIIQHMSEIMFDELTTADFIGVFEQLRAEKPWIATKFAGNGDQAVLRLQAAQGTALEMNISLDSGGMINGLFFAPAQADRTPAANWDELEEAVQALPASTSLSVSRVTDQPETVLAVDEDSVMPIGSIFKLYVLAAIVDAVETGSLGWDSTLTITDDVRSLPSGTLQDEPTGTVVTVREAADLMISISDNTATDMLMQAVGRDAVEKAQTRLGHHDPALNTPFLSTREMFQLGWGKPAEARDQWTKASVAERRTILARLPTGALNIDPAAASEPVWQRGLDWFANAADLRAAHLGLQELATSEAGKPVREILAMNAGAGMSIGEEWTYVGFKGGSSAGELAGSWYVERADGERFTLSIQAASDDPAALMDIRAYFGPIEDSLALLAND